MNGTRKTGKISANNDNNYPGTLNYTGSTWFFMLGKTTIMWYKSHFYDKSQDGEI
jgi:hypothetical protein